MEFGDLSGNNICVFMMTNNHKRVSVFIHPTLKEMCHESLPDKLNALIQESMKEKMESATEPIITTQNNSSDRIGIESSTALSSSTTDEVRAHLSNVETETIVNVDVDRGEDGSEIGEDDLFSDIIAENE